VKAKLIATLTTLVVLTMLLVGCKGPSPSVSPLISPLAPTSAIYLSQSTPPSTVQPLVFPTSQPSLATLTGILVRAGTQTSIQNDLYLGEMIETSDPNHPMVGLDTTEAPKAVLDTNTGAFAFYDVPPGKYALAIWQPLGAPILIEDKVTGGTLFLTLEAKDHIDLGTIEVTIP